AHPELHAFPTRRSSDLMRAIRKSGGLALEPLPDVMRAPRSVPRTVMIPANGASSRWNDCSAVRRWTLASLAATLARAAPTLASRSEEHTSELQSPDHLV